MDSEIIIEKKKPNKLVVIRQVFAIIKSQSIMQRKSCNCKHEDGCLYNVIEGFIRAFGLAYAAKALFAIISVILSRNKKISKGKQLLNGLFGSDILQFSTFPAVYNLIQKSVLCSCRMFSDQDKKWFTMLSGFLAGAISLNIMDQPKRKNWALYLLTRSFDTIFQSLQNKDYIRPRSYYYVVFMALEVLITSYAFGSETDCLEDYMHKFYNRFSGETQTELDYRATWHEKKRIILEKAYDHLRKK